jgi:Family of unknown function (DUF5317)
VLWWPVAVGSLAWLLLLHNHPIDQQSWAIEFGPLLWTACLAGLFVMLLRNGVGDRAHRAAWAVAALGAGLNLLVVSVNGGYMPQSAEARVVTRGATIDATGQPQLRNVRAMNDATVLGGLGDILAEPFWFPKANVVSIGDVLLGLGIAWWAFSVTANRSITRREEA